jgi:large subunit ribosomal protein L23
MSAFSKDRLAGVVIAPHVSEKSARVAAEGNQYVFRVRTDATKPEIRAAVEVLFKVKVKAVNTVYVRGKNKMFRGRAGKRSDWKKAIVSLAEGQTIDVTTGV